MLLAFLLSAPVARAEPPPSPEAVAPPSWCPFAESPAVVTVSLLAGRAQLDVDPSDGEVLSGFASLGFDPHAVAPLDPWKDVVRWDGPDGATALLILEEPIRFAQRDLGPAVEEGVARRLGDDAAATLSEVTIRPSERGVRARARAGSMPDGGWMMVVAYALPDKSEVDATIVLLGPASEDDVCRDAAAARLAGLRPGPRPRERGGEPLAWPLPTGGTMHLAIPDGYAAVVEIGWEFTVLRVKRWARRGQAVEQYEIIYSIAPNARPTFDTPALATATLLGEPAEWRSVEPDRDEAWARGLVGDERFGTTLIVVTAPSPRARARLRRLVEDVWFEPGAAAPDAPLRVRTGELPADEGPNGPQPSAPEP